MKGFLDLAWRSTLLIILIASVTGCATADGGSSGGTTGRGDLPGGQGGFGAPPALSADEIVAALDLTDGQAPSVRAILDLSEGARDSLLESLGGSPERSQIAALRTEMEQIEEETRDQLSEVLSEEQLAAYDALIERHREETRAEMQEQMRGRGGPGGGRGGGRPGGF